jgi:lysophospholipase L1-like esterase
LNYNPLAKRILCFGDSLTWGYIPGTKLHRHRADVRWPGVLQRDLGDKYLDLQTVVSVGRDGVHLDAESHAKLGRAVADLVR